MNTHIHTKKQKINYIRKFYESQKVVEGFKFSNNFIKQWDNFSILKKSLKDRELVYQKNIKDDIHPAYQLRRYGWSAKLPLSILTDFQEWAVYDCRLKPNPRDTAAVGRIMYLTADQ